ncbi:SGNH/GDSL hydrolase family protein [Arthrobacter sp. 24S4-2]|uniref:SGNH/GDSL hydrolase family protein n=1 Tax=Arthrobacter sp. 24S4-2 TaxID=2575374 RepID=UPI0020C750C6|nr:SGNH/GDSL hydrolase family protein [Arthrobacter sp. 24S4-2]
MTTNDKDLSGRRPRSAVAGAAYVEGASHHPWRRYVALGDSFTEGVGDPDPRSPGGVRGWADRAAEELSIGHEEFAYANLAVRGLLLEQILERQIGPALALEPDLITLSAGGNDMVFHSSDPDKLADRLDAGVELLSSAGATLVLFTGPDWGSTPFLGRNRTKVAVFNENIRAIASRHDAVIADLWGIRELRNPRMWDQDRLHLSPLGHHAVALMVLDTLGVPHRLRPLEPGAVPPRNWQQARAGDLVWARRYLLPWAWHRLRKRAAMDEPRAKRPTAAPPATSAPVTGFVVHSFRQ